MPPKTHIHTEPVTPRVRPVGNLGIVDWREDCSSCHNCVKRGCSGSGLHESNCAARWTSRVDTILHIGSRRPFAKPFPASNR